MSPSPTNATTTTTTSTTSQTLGSLSVYPTQPNFTSIQLDYQDYSLSSPIVLQAVHDSGYPGALSVSFKPEGAKAYSTDSVSITPSASGTTSVRVNVTLDCSKGGCALPMGYTLTLSASSGAYSQNDVIQLNLLKAKWLVMLYSAADTGKGPGTKGDLENPMGVNVLEMAAASKSNNNPAVGMLVLFDAGWPITFQSDYTAPGTTTQPENSIRLYRVANGTMTQIGADWSQTATNRPSTLREFIDAAMALTPADRNQLILSDHGGGITGFAWDFRDGNSPMSVPDLATALSGVSPKLDILSFDACLMGQVDVLYQLSSYATYFTASERKVPGPGYDYTGFLGSLLKNPDQSTLDYLKVIVSTYATKYPETATGGATLAAIDPSKLEDVVSGLDTLSNLLVQQYKAKDPAFNATMLQVLGKSVYADKFKKAGGRSNYPYVDIRSLAQNILLSPQITDQSIKNAASSLIQAAKSAVIANTTANIMYEGLTALLWQQAGVPKLAYQEYASAEFGLANGADWLPLVQCVNRSLSLSTVGWTLVLLVHPGHQLYLNVYNSTGEHVGINPSLLNESRTEIEVIPGSFYLELNSSATLIALPPSVGSFRTVVDGTSMMEASEPYTLTYTVVKNGTVSSTKAVQGTMGQNTLQSMPVAIQDGNLSVGQITVTTATAAYSSTRSTGGTQPPPSTALPPLLYGVAGVAVLVVVVIGAVAVKSRRRGRRPAYGAQAQQATNYCNSCGAPLQ